MLHSDGRRNYNGRIIDLLAIAALLADAVTALELDPNGPLSGMNEAELEVFETPIVHQLKALLARVEDQVNAGVYPIPMDEPVFLLRAQDETAAFVVDHWASKNEAKGGSPELVGTARAHAELMRQWPVKKLAD